MAILNEISCDKIMVDITNNGVLGVITKYRLFYNVANEKVNEWPT